MDLVARLDAGSAACLADTPETTWYEMAYRLIATQPDTVEIDLTDLQDILPPATDIETCNRLAIALTVLEVEDDDQDSVDAAIALWETARPTKKSRTTGGTRTPKASDNSADWTNLVITRTATSEELFRTRRDGGAMSSLYYPVGDYLQTNLACSAQQWDACRTWIKTAAKSASPGTVTCGDFTVTLTKGE
jgi:hypothetical protein